MPFTRTTSSALRVMYLPYERSAGSEQVGPRQAFAELAASGDLAALETFSFMRQAREHGMAGARDRLAATAQQFSPDLIFWQHVSEFEIDRAFIAALKGIASKPRLVYHENDPYGRVLKRVTTPMRALFAEADLVFMSGTGSFGALARRAGARRVLYAPQNFDRVRFGTDWTPTTQRQYDAVMIGNLGSTRLPGVYLPGARRRLRLVRAMCERFGDRFALYGSGWGDLPCAKGPLPFDQQESAIRSAWVSVNWDHFDDVPYYFSNRLAISLAAGVPHVATYHRGYEDLLRGCDGFFPAKGVPEVPEIVTWLLSKPREDLLRIGQAGRDYAFAHLESTKVYRDILAVCRHELFPTGAGDHQASAPR